MIVFNFLRYYCIDFHSDCINLNSHPQCKTSPLLPLPTFVFYYFLDNSHLDLSKVKSYCIFNLKYPIG